MHSSIFVKSGNMASFSPKQESWTKQINKLRVTIKGRNQKINQNRIRVRTNFFSKEPSTCIKYHSRDKLYICSWRYFSEKIKPYMIKLCQGWDNLTTFSMALSIKRLQPLSPYKAFLSGERKIWKSWELTSRCATSFLLCKVLNS